MSTLRCSAGHDRWTARAVITNADASLTVDSDSGRNQHFYRARRSDVRDLLETLAALGHVEVTEEGAYAASED